LTYSKTIVSPIKPSFCQAKAKKTLFCWDQGFRKGLQTTISAAASSFSGCPQPQLWLHRPHLFAISHNIKEHDKATTSIDHTYLKPWLG